MGHDARRRVSLRIGQLLRDLGCRQSVRQESRSLALANRLYLGPTIAVGGTAGDRYEGATVLSNGDRVPRNALRGLPIHKVDLRLAKAVRMSKLELQGILEVFNVFNRNNFGTYNGVVTSPQFGAPLQNPGNTYRPRTGQLAFRVSF